MRKREPYDTSTVAGQKRLMAESVGGTYVPDTYVALGASGDHGCDPLDNGTFRMIPSGDIVDYAERVKRLSRYRR
jgi:hypothetical protein